VLSLQIEWVNAISFRFDSFTVQNVRLMAWFFTANSGDPGRANGCPHSAHNGHSLHCSTKVAIGLTTDKGLH
jgi:hypothetical protein